MGHEWFQGQAQRTSDESSFATACDSTARENGQTPNFARYS